jgi:hypothetical protein
MMNPSSMLKIMNAQKKFQSNHPKFVSFLKVVFGSQIEAGTIIEVTVQKPGEEPITSNLKVQDSDLELLKSLSELS